MSRHRKPLIHENHRKGLRGPNGRPCCKRCGEEVPKRRRAWCGDRCIREWELSWYWPTIRLAAYQRDAGLCQLCGFDSKLAERIRRRVDQIAISVAYRIPEAFALVLELWGVPLRNPWRDLWDADHEEPLWAGGSLSVANVRVLCIPCHKEKTKREAGERAALKRREDADEVLREIRGGP